MDGFMFTNSKLIWRNDRGTTQSNKKQVIEEKYKNMYW